MVPPGWLRNSSSLVERESSPLTGLRELGEDLKHMSPKTGDTEDVVVIGSSAAGLYTAARVARGGRRVSVLESKATPDPAPRTLIVTDYFKNQISSAARSSILNEIRRFELFTDGRSAQVTLKRPDLIIERSRLIRSLAEEAVHAGAKLRYDTRFLDLSPNAKGLHVQVDEGGKREELHAASVIGADDAGSVQLLTFPALVDLDVEALGVRREIQKPRVVAEFCAGVDGFLGQRADQSRPLDDQVGPLEGNLRGASVGEQFKAADFIQDAGASGGADLVLEIIGDNQGARRGIWRRFRFQHADAAAATGNARGGV